MSATNAAQNDIVLVIRSVRQASSRLLKRLLVILARLEGLDRPGRPLSGSVGLQSLPPEVLDIVGSHLDPPESLLGLVDDFQLEASSILRGTLRSPSNRDQLSLHWVCRHTLYCFTPKLRIRLPDTRAVQIWTEAPQALASLVHQLDIDFRHSFYRDVKKPNLLDVFSNVARCLIRMHRVQQLAVRGLPGNICCRKCRGFRPDCVAGFETLAQEVRLPGLRCLEISSEEVQPCKKSRRVTRGRNDIRCCRSCRQLESIFDRSLDGLEVLKLDLVRFPWTSKSSDLTEKASLPALPTSLKRLCIRSPQQCGTRAHPDRPSMTFENPQRPILQILFVSYEGANVLDLRRGEWGTTGSAVDDLVQQNFSSPIRAQQWLDLCSQAEELDPLLKLKQCKPDCLLSQCYCRPRPFWSLLSAGREPHLLTEMGDKVRRRVECMKRDKSAENLQRDVVLDFARAFPRLRKLWVWHDSVSGPYASKDENTISCRVCWTIEYIAAEVQASRVADYEVYIKGARCRHEGSWGYANPSARWRRPVSDPDSGPSNACCSEVRYLGTL